MNKAILILTLLLSMNISADGFDERDQGNYKRAAELFEKSCNEGDFIGCESLKQLFDTDGQLKSEGVFAEEKGNYKQAAQLYRKSCNTGDMKSCSNLGTLLLLGSGEITKDKEQAREFLAKACDNRNGEGCFTLGVMYFNGDGVEKNRPHAKELFRISCESGAADGCAGHKMAIAEENSRND